MMGIDDSFASEKPEHEGRVTQDERQERHNPAEHQREGAMFVGCCSEINAIGNDERKEARRQAEITGEKNH